MSCKYCQWFFAVHRCSAQTHGECDCPKCQGMCECHIKDEPSAWMDQYGNVSITKYDNFTVPLYPQRKRLTDGQIDALIDAEVSITDQNLRGAVYMAMRAVEQAHGIEE